MTLHHYALRRTPTGLGLFTLLVIPSGKRIIEYTGPIISAAEVERKGGKYLFEIDGERAVDGSSRSNLARYINHSCRSNAKAYVTGRRIWIWSKKVIDAGEEITINYGTEYFNEFIKGKGCRCQKCYAERQLQ